MTNAEAIGTVAKTSIPVLLYHRIAARPDDRVAVDPALFARHLDLVAASGRTPMTIAELAGALRGERPMPLRPVAITFDDGYDDTVASVQSLNDRGLSSTIYVTIGTLGQPGRLSEQQLSELAGMQEVVALGAHTESHPHLDELSLPAVREEVVGSKLILEDLIGRRVDSFAYPYGSYDGRVRHAVIEAGFTSAAAVKNAISHQDDDPWAIARYMVTRDTSLALIEQLLEGRGAPDAWPGARLRTRAWRVARVARRQILLKASQ